MRQPRILQHSRSQGIKSGAEAANTGLHERWTPSRSILSTTKRSDSVFLATGQDIYHVKKRERAEFLLGRNPLRALLDTLDETAIRHEIDRDPSSGPLTRILIAPNPFISTDNDSSSGGVLIADSTYKTNR